MEHHCPESTQPPSSPGIELGVHADDDVEFAETEESRKLVYPEMQQLLYLLKQILLNSIWPLRGMLVNSIRIWEAVSS